MQALWRGFWGIENVAWAVQEIQDEGQLTTTSVIPQSLAPGGGR